MIFFKRKTEREKLSGSISKLERKILNLELYRDSLQPQIKTTFFSKKEVKEEIPISRCKKIERLTSQISDLKEKLLILKNNQ